MFARAIEVLNSISCCDFTIRRLESTHDLSFGFILQSSLFQGEFVAYCPIYPSGPKCAQLHPLFPTPFTCDHQLAMTRRAPATAHYIMHANFRKAVAPRCCLKQGHASKLLP
jgi:hypothetical protein